MAGSRVGLFDNLNIPIHRDAQHREDQTRSVISYASSERWTRSLYSIANTFTFLANTAAFCHLFCRPRGDGVPPALAAGGGTGW